MLMEDEEDGEVSLLYNKNNNNNNINNNNINNNNEFKLILI